MRAACMTKPVTIFNTDRTQVTDCHERELIARCGAGDRRALEHVYRQYHRRVFSLVARMVGPQDAEELAQDVFVRVFRGLKSFRGDAALGTWIYRVAMNTCLTFLARRTRRSKLDDQYKNEQVDPGLLFGQQGTPSPLLRSKLEDALQELSPGYRAVLVLHDVEGLNHQEIAEILDCREGTSKSQLHKARMKMRELLQPALVAEAV